METKVKFSMFGEVYQLKRDITTEIEKINKMYSESMGYTLTAVRISWESITSVYERKNNPLGIIDAVDNSSDFKTNAFVTLEFKK